MRSIRRSLPAAFLLLLLASPSSAERAPDLASPDTVSARTALAPTLRVLGGTEAFADLQRYTARLGATLYREGDTTRATAALAWEAPHTLRRTNALRGVGTIAFVVDGTDVWFQGARDSTLAPASDGARAYLQAGYWRTLPVLLAHAARDTDGLRAVRHARTDTTVVWTVLPPDGSRFRLHVDAATGRPLKRVVEQQGTVVEDAFAELRVVGPARLPFRVTSSRDGRRSEIIQYTDQAWNPSAIPASVPAVP